MLTTLTEGKNQLDALALRLLAEPSAPRPPRVRRRCAADWLAVETRQSAATPGPPEARELPETDLVAAAMAAAGSTRASPGDRDRARSAAAHGEFAVTAEQRHQAEAHLVGLDAEHDAKALRILGRRIFEVIAPDLAEQFEGKVLERKRPGARRTTLTMREDDEGTAHGRFRIPAGMDRCCPR